MRFQPTEQTGRLSLSMIHRAARQQSIILKKQKQALFLIRKQQSSRLIQDFQQEKSRLRTMVSQNF